MSGSKSGTGIPACVVRVPDATIEPTGKNACATPTRAPDPQPVSEPLPPGWTMTTLAVLAKAGGMCNDGDWVESVDQDPAGDVRLIQLADIGEGFFRDRSNRFMTSAKAEELSCTFLEKGDLLIARMADPIGRACIFPGDAKRSVTVVDVCVFRPPIDSVEPKWLTTIFNNGLMRQSILALASGTTRARISRSKLIQIPFPLPPLPEQRRIVARLEALEARSRRAREKLAAVPAQLAQARQSLLAAAFRGDLTAGWRTTSGPAQSGHDLLALLQAYHADSPSKKGNAAQATEGVHELDSASLPSSWAIADLRTLCRPDRPICYGILMPGPELEEGVPYVRVADFPKDRIRLETVRKTSREIDAKFARSRLSTGDILLSIRGTVGRLAVVPPELEGANITQDTARLSIHPSVSSDFVLLMLRSPDTLLRMQAAVKGVAVRGINIGDVRPLQIPLPPLPEQHEIVRRLSAAFARLDAAAGAHAAAVAALDRLDQSLLARAFSGAL